MRISFLLVFSAVVASCLFGQSESSRNCDDQYQRWKARQDQNEGSKFYGDTFDEPSIIKIQPAVYPDSAKKYGLEADLKVWILIDTTGKPVCTKIVQGARADFEDAVLLAIQNSQFKPVVFKGVKQESAIVLPFRFRMKGKD